MLLHFFFLVAASLFVAEDDIVDEGIRDGATLAHE